MRRIQKLAMGASKKSFAEPPFWSLERLNNRLLTFPPSGDRETIENSFSGYIQRAYKEDGIIFACVLARQWILSQARFQWVEFTDGRPGRPFASPALSLLDRPWVNGNMSDLISRMEAVIAGGGNYYGTVADDLGRLGRAATGPGRRIVHMNPEWTEIIIGSFSGDPWALDAKIAGYKYTPRSSMGVLAEPVILLPQEVCHYAPTPDPAARFRGMSWLTPVLREIEADKAATLHKAKFFENGATPAVMCSLKDVNEQEFDDFVEKFNQNHKGAANAYKTLFLMGGVDTTVIGTDLRQLDFKASQGAGETRIAAASGIHPVILGISEGLEGSSLNAGNFNAARRLTSDKSLQYLWRSLAGSLETLFDKPSDRAVLWPDLTQVEFVREDMKDLADIAFREAQTIRALVDAGFQNESVTDAVLLRDWSLLKHTGLFSVQLQRPGTTVTNGAQPPSDDEEES